MISEGHTIDLARRLQLPASRGAYNVTAILLDQVSNQCRMKLVEAAGYEDPEVERFLREHLAAALDTPHAAVGDVAQWGIRSEKFPQLERESQIWSCSGWRSL